MEESDETVVKTMDEIADSTQRIGSITALINDIAFRPTFWRSMPQWRPPVPVSRAKVLQWWGSSPPCQP
jgi:hypothetical protein